MDLLIAAVVTLGLVVGAGRLWQRRNPELATYNRLPARDQRRVAASVYAGGEVMTGAEDEAVQAQLQEAVREFEASARRWNRPGPTVAVWLAVTVVFVAAAAAARGGLDATLLVWLAPFWLALLPGVLRWQRIRLRILDGAESERASLWRNSPAKALLLFLAQSLPLMVLLSNITMMVQAATAIESDALAGGGQGGLMVAYMVWFAPARSVRDTFPVFLGWTVVLLLLGGALGLAGLRPTDAL